MMGTAYIHRKMVGHRFAIRDTIMNPLCPSTMEMAIVGKAMLDRVFVGRCQLVAYDYAPLL